MTLLEKAFTFARERHKNHFRRNGKTPYFTHCEKVASLVDNDFQKSIAFCHDLLEDEKATYDEISKELSEDVAFNVFKLSHREGEEYVTYIERLKRDSDLVKIIKIADIVANLSDNPTQKQIVKYNKALRILALRYI